MAEDRFLQQEGDGMIAWAQRGWERKLPGLYKHPRYGMVVSDGPGHWHAYSRDQRRQWPVYETETMSTAMQALETRCALKEAK
jgi:hypothetical protein